MVYIITKFCDYNFFQSQVKVEPKQSLKKFTQNRVNVFICKCTDQLKQDINLGAEAGTLEEKENQLKNQLNKSEILKIWNKPV